MATTPPTPNQPKKPAGTPPVAGAKPAVPGQPGAKPAVPGQPGQKPANPAAQRPAVPGQKPAVPGQKPTGPKPPAPPVKKPAPPKNKFSHVDATTKQLGQKLVDLGYLDDAQLESIYEEIADERPEDGGNRRRTAARFGRPASRRDRRTPRHEGRYAGGPKPSKEAIKVVPQNMAELYKMVPLDFEADTLTVAMSDPNNLQALDDIRNFLGIRQVNAVLAPASAVAEPDEEVLPGRPGGRGVDREHHRSNSRATRISPRTAGGKRASTSTT